MKPNILSIGFCLMLLIFSGCSIQTECEMKKVEGESFVLIDRQPSQFLHSDIQPGSVTVRNKYEADTTPVTLYKENQDYQIDYQTGTIRRTEKSKIPDFSENILYGQTDFDQGDFPGYGNRNWFIYADYISKNGCPLCEIAKTDRLPGMKQKLENGELLRILVFGDSISGGGEASKPRLTYYERYTEYLRTKYPETEIILENQSTGGDTTQMALERMEEKVLNQKPDVVLIGFGMNDHNKEIVGGVDPQSFEENLKSMVEQIKQQTDAEVILLSTFPPNPLWTWGTHRMDEYAQITRQVANETQSAYADVFGVWQKVLERKRHESLLTNNINHPNDFGHWLYLEALKCIRF